MNKTTLGDLMPDYERELLEERKNPPLTVRVAVNRDPYDVTFDEYDVLDTVVRVRDGKAMSNKNAAAKRIYTHNQTIRRRGILPAGMAYVKGDTK